MNGLKLNLRGVEVKARDPLLPASGESRVAFQLFKGPLNMILMCHSCSGNIHGRHRFSLWWTKALMWCWVTFPTENVHNKVKGINNQYYGSVYIQVHTHPHSKLNAFWSTDLISSERRNKSPLNTCLVTVPENPPLMSSGKFCCVC